MSFNNSNKEKKMSSEVIKTNKLNTALQNLSLAEMRLVQVAIVDCRDTQTGLSPSKPLRVTALRYAKAFGIEPQTAYEALISAEKTLFERRFTFINERQNEVKSRWLSQVEYVKGEGAIELIFSPAVINEITRIDGFKDRFTSYLLEQTASLNSVYSVRIYELLVQWLSARKATFELETFRGQIGLGVNEYKRMSDFKKRVLDLAVNEINEKTDLTVSYKNKTQGRKVVGFNFTIKQKPQPKKDKDKDKDDIKAQNADLFTIDNYSDAQLARITRSPDFIKDYSRRISPNSDMNKDMSLWTAHFVQELKKDASKFNKRPIKDYLDY